MRNWFFSAECLYVRYLQVTHGKFYVTLENIYFFISKDKNELRKSDKKWPLKKLTSVLLRKYLLRPNSLEIFFKNNKNYFLSFDNMKIRDKIFKLLNPFCSSHVNTNETTGSMLTQIQFNTAKSSGSFFLSVVADQGGNYFTPKEMIEHSNWTKRWQNCEISNFQYLMQLNTIAGRTYNDLTQYPVFPWILSDYESETLDLSDPSVYRDLSKPVGALDPIKREQLQERYAEFDGSEFPAFHFGSHYSNLGVVLYFLLRVSPFTENCIHLQGGKFDIADRLFHSMGTAWRNCMISNSDVKELIPELFYMPECVTNINNLDIGATQNEQILDDVVLPPWASSAEEFIYLHRKALESEYVSENLHHWIDLIFGYKQRGKEAEKACNVFHYLTYEENCSLIEKEVDPVQRKAIEAQIANFGQTPTQLFTEPHPQRNIKMYRDAQKHTLFGLSPYLHHKVCDSEPVSIYQTPSFVFIFTCDSKIYKFKWQEVYNGEGLPFTLDACGSVVSGLEPPFGFFEDNEPIPEIVGCRENTLCLFNFKDIHQKVWFHTRKITKMSSSGNFIVTGGEDCYVCVWEITKTKALKKLTERPKHILRAHSDVITSLCVSADLDTILSGSKDGTVIQHSLNGGEYIRSFSLEASVDAVKISQDGYIVMYSKESGNLRTCTLNGYIVSDIFLPPQENDINTILITKSNLVITAGEILTFRDLRKLDDILFELDYNQKEDRGSTIVSIALSQSQNHLFVALQDGGLLVYSIDKTGLLKPLDEEDDTSFFLV